MSKSLVFILGFLCAALIIGQAQGESLGFVQTSSLKRSQPYEEILAKVRKLMGKRNEGRLSDQITFLTTLSSEELINYFVNFQYKNVEEYWFQYYLLSQFVFFQDTRVELPLFSQSADLNYQEFLRLEASLNSSLETCKKTSNHFLATTLKLKQNKNLRIEGSLLSNLEYNHTTLELIEKDKFYNLIFQKMPKGVIHHFHWPAGLDYQRLFQSVQTVLKSYSEDDDERFIVISVNLYLEDGTSPKQLTEKFFTKFFITKQKYTKTSNLLETIQNHQALLEAFTNNLILNGKCLNFLKDDNLFNPSGIDTFLKGFLYWKSCGGVLYDDSTKNQEGENGDSLKYLMKEIFIGIQQPQQFEDLLPFAYLEDNQNESNRAKQISGKWFYFEEIFQAISELTDNMVLFKEINSNLFQSFSEQKIYGIEFRNKNDLEQLNNFDNASKEYSVPFSFITPGRKQAGKRSKGSAIIQNASKIQNPHFAGIDFFAYEDDPYSGARNFFTSTFTEIQKGEKQSYFDQLFSVLNQNISNLYLHAGETLYFPKDKIDIEYSKNNYINDNLLHAALLPSTKRIGHGFESINSNLLLNIYKQKNIAFESCPISNEVLGYHSIEEQIALKLLRKGIAVSISPDDPGFFGYSGVAMDWYFLIMKSNVKPSEIYLFLKNSIDHSTIPEIRENKQKYLDQIKEELLTFFSEMNTVCDANAFNSINQISAKFNYKNLFAIAFLFSILIIIYFSKKMKQEKQNQEKEQYTSIQLQLL